MHSFKLLAAAPVFFVSLAVAQESDIASVPTAASVDSTALPDPSNPFTTFLTQTNGDGVITGQPNLITTQPGLVLTQPAIATIPAGLPNGINTVPIGNSTTVIVSVGTSTTAIVGGGGEASSTGNGGENESGNDAGDTGTATESAEATSTTGAASRIKAAGGALVGAGIFVVAWL